MTPALIALLINLIPPIIQGVELAFRTKDKSGPDKMQAVLRSVGQITETMLAAGVPLPDGTQKPEKSIDDKVVRGLAEAELARLKAAGRLTASPAAELFLVRGVVVPIPSI